MTLSFKNYAPFFFSFFIVFPIYATPPIVISDRNNREIIPSGLGHLEIMQDALQEQMKGFLGKIEETEHRLEMLENGLKRVELALENLSNAQNIVSELKTDTASLSEEDAIKKEETIEEKKPDAEAIMNEALTALEEKSYEKSEILWKKFVELYPKNPYVSDAYYWLGDLAYMREGYEDSSVCFYHAYQAAPQGTKAAHNLLKLSMSLLKLKKIKPACTTLNKMLKEFPVLDYSLRKQVDLLLKEANCTSH